MPKWLYILHPIWIAAFAIALGAAYVFHLI